MFSTRDGTRIAYDTYGTSDPRLWAVYLHMMPATKSSWRVLAPRLAAGGVYGIAIDMRGHGSSSGGPAGYLKFSDKEHQASIEDIDVAVTYLKEQGASDGHIMLFGASIGANLAAWYLAEHPTLRGAVLFSPGLNYRGIEPAVHAKDIKAGTNILLFSSEDDFEHSASHTHGNADEVREIYESLPAGVKKDLVIYKKGGHGTHILATSEAPDPFGRIEAFLGL